MRQMITLAILLFAPVLAPEHARAQVQMVPISLPDDPPQIAMQLGSTVADRYAVPQVVQQACHSVGKIILDEGGSQSHGSGTYIGDGLWLTNAHVVLGRGAYSVRLKTGQTLPARLLRVEQDRQPDLAILETKNLDHTIRPIPIAGDLPQQGDIVYPSGFDRGDMHNHRVWPARIMRFFTDGDMESVGTTGRKGAISGNSGGPTFTANGELISPLFANGGSDTYSGRGTTITVSWRGTRTFLLPFRERIMRAIVQCQNGQCPPQRYAPPQQYQPQYQPPPPGYGIDPGGSPGDTVPSYQPQPQTQPAPAPQAGCPNCQGPACPCPPQRETGVDYEKLADTLIPIIAEDDRFRGPPGKDGADGEVQAAQLAAITQSILAVIREDDRFRGPAGEPGQAGPRGPAGPQGQPGMDGMAADIDVDALAAQILSRVQHPSQRVVLVDGKSGSVIDDETYQPGEPIVLDFQSIIKSARTNGR